MRVYTAETEVPGHPSQGWGEGSTEPAGRALVAASRGLTRPVDLMAAQALVSGGSRRLTRAGVAVLTVPPSVIQILGLFAVPS